MSEKEHVVVQTSTAGYPSENGWLYYYCQTCKPMDAICAATFNHGSWFDHEGYSVALGQFNRKHPHTQVLISRWACQN